MSGPRGDPAGDRRPAADLGRQSASNETPMRIQIREEPLSSLADYARIPWYKRLAMHASAG